MNSMWVSGMDFFVHGRSSTATTLLFIVLSMVIVVGRRRRRRYHPVAGTIVNQLMNFSRLHDYMTRLASQHKTYRLLAPFRSEVYTSNPANVEYILKTNFHNYAKGWHNRSILKDLLGDGIFTVDGDKWREQRKVSSHEFSAKALREVSTIVFRDNAVKLANVVSEAMLSGQAMDIQDLFMRTTLDSIFRVAFGSGLDSMREEAARFSQAFDDASEMTAWRYVDVLWRIKRALNVGLEAKLKDKVRVVDEFVYKMIRTRIDQMQNSVSLKKGDLLSRFLDISEADPKYLRDVVLNFVMAGKDTTATTLSWFFYMMCKHPLSQEKLAREIEEMDRSNGGGNVSAYAASLSEESLDKMHYLHAALSETLRLFPPVPVNPKMCLSDDTLPDGYRVRRGDVVAYQPYAMGRMTFIWGDDAAEFRPERWIDSKGCFQQESPFKFPAFQAGPRICLGKEFAYRQMKILSAVLFRFFAFRLSDESKAVKYKTMINLHVDGGLYLCARPRSQLEHQLVK